VIKNTEAKDGNITVFVDASHNDDKDSASTTLCYYITLNGVLLLARTKKKSRIMNATHGDEIRAVFESIGPTMRIKRMLQGSGWHIKEVRILSDNEATLKTLCGGSIPEKSRFLKPKYLMVRQLRANNEIKLAYIKSERNHADLGTKARFTRRKFYDHFNALMTSNMNLEPDKWY
jgi:hypothetical protein